jgi:hypothetical protein
MAERRAITIATVSLLLALLLVSCGGDAAANAALKGVSEDVANREIDTIQNAIIMDMYPQTRLTENERKNKKRARELIDQSTAKLRPQLVEMFRMRDVALFEETKADARTMIENEFTIALDKELEQVKKELRRMLEDYRKRRR